MKAGIRVARPEDAAQIADLCTQLGYPSTSMEITRRLAEILSRPEHAVFVAERNGRLAGWVHIFACLTVESDQCAEVGGLVVGEGQRHQGVGTALMKKAEAWARQCSLPEVRVRSNILRTGAHEFYSAIGYDIIKTQSTFRKKLQPHPS